jgi:Asp-tRNA(Asn)/Glu-tRNA(Gln) amidotransferase A subunit family amidase
MIEVETDVTAPQDRMVDRRSFLTRMTAFSAAGAIVPLTGCGVMARAQGTRMPVPESRLSEGSVRAAYASAVRPEALTDPTELTIAEAARLIRDRRLSPVELVDACLARVAAFDETYRAFNLVLTDSARAEAIRLTDERHRGPLHGIPLAIKDLFYTAGIPTTANSFIFQDFIPAFDATCVSRLRDEGSVILGKTQMGPLATTRATTPMGEITTVNAWTPEDPSISPGGSSSGSATAVAGRLATSSIGTQTGGSITAPSLAQGLTGLKPTMGRVSNHGVIPLSYTRDHPGPIARDAKDAAILLQALAGADPNDARTAGFPPVPDLIAAATPVNRGGRTVLRWPTTLGVIPEYASGDTPAAKARTAMLAEFERIGVRIVEVELPEDWEILTGSAFNNVRLVERSEQLLPYLKQDVRLFGVSLSGWINGLFVSGDEYLKGQRAKLLLLRRVLDDVFAQCDVVVQTGPVPFDIIGLPEIAFPIGFDTSGERPRPVGAILGGLPCAEDRLLSVVAAYQAVTDWHLQRPADPVPGAGPPGSSDRGMIRMEEVMATGE